MAQRLAERDNQSLQDKVRHLEDSLQFERSRPQPQVQRQDVLLDRSMPLPENELRPPPGFVIPGIPQLETLVKSLGVFSGQQVASDSKVNTAVPNLQEGEPLSRLSSRLENEALLSGSMESAARQVRQHMRENVVSAPSAALASAASTNPQHGESVTRLSDFQLGDAAPRTWQPEVSLAARSWDVQEPVPDVLALDDEVEAVGLPITDRAEQLLGRVAYSEEGHTTQTPVPPHRASVVRLSEADYRRCVAYNLDLTQEEYPVLLSGDASAQKPETIVSKKVRDYAGGKLREEADRNEQQLKVAQQALKCSLASQSAAEATRVALSLALNGLNALRNALRSQDPALYNQVGDVRREVEVARQAAFYADQSSLASTEASAQSCRQAVMRQRAMTVEAVFKAPPMPVKAKGGTSKVQPQRRFLPHRLVRAANRAPVVPSSLFGGRMFSGFSELGKLSEGRKALDKIAEAVGAQVQTGESASSKPFPKGGRGGNPKAGDKQRKKKKHRPNKSSRRKAREAKAESQGNQGGGNTGGGKDSSKKRSKAKPKAKK